MSLAECFFNERMEMRVKIEKTATGAFTDAAMFRHYNNQSTEYDGNDSDLLKMNKFAVSIIPIILTELQQEAFIKRYIDGKTIAAVAQEMGITDKTVYKHLRVAEKKIMKCCELYIHAATGKSYIAMLTAKLESELRKIPEEYARILRGFYIDGVTYKDLRKKYNCKNTTIGFAFRKYKPVLNYNGLKKLELNRIRRNAIENKKKEGEA